MEIQVGDIFVHSNRCASFFQVVKLYSNDRVKVREINSFVNGKYAMPLKDNFKENSHFIKDDGAIKKITRFEDNTYYINIGSCGTFLWNNKPVEEFRYED